VARISGRRGVIYMDIAGGGAASALPFFAKWSIKFGTDKTDVTAMSDLNKIYVSGLPDASGDFSGFYDDATAQTYTAATDGVARAFYLYPSTAKATQYFFGTVLVDFSVNGDVGGAVEVSASWNAASTIAKVG
jgi:hypothetical protein